MPKPGGASACLLRRPRVRAREKGTTNVLFLQVLYHTEPKKAHVSQRFREALKDESDFKGSPFFSDNEIC